MEEDIYFTIDERAEGSYKEKGSKFISYIYPVTTKEEVKEIVDALKKEFYDARHHCYAYRLGYRGEDYRMVDDGEPSSTAGKPILGQMLSSNITNILIVVVRYFGGTKLGVSGLITAYKTAAADVIQNSTIVEKTIENIIKIEFDYSEMNDVMRVLKDSSSYIIKREYGNTSIFTISIRQKEASMLIERLSLLEKVKLILD